MSESPNPSLSPPVDGALRDLFAPVARPRPRPGFEQRLAHAIAENADRERTRRRLVAGLWIYSLVALASSSFILWRLRELLLGPGLWLGLISGGLLALMALLYGMVVSRRGRPRSRFALIG